MDKVPTVADLRARRIELTIATLRETLLGDDLDHYRVVVETLSDEFDVMEVALAAVKVAHEATGADDDQEIPEVQPRPDRGPRPDRPDRFGQTDRGERVFRGDRPRAGAGAGMTRLFIGAGRQAGVRPKDLVGAIANETSLSGRDIGAIEIADKFSLVEVPDAAVDEVIRAIKATTIKGKKTSIRRERER
jgi:ATP-dependent RNA helicase DeaD